MKDVYLCCKCGFVSTISSEFVIDLDNNSDKEIFLCKECLNTEVVNDK